MAKWTKNKVNPEQINNGNEYNVNDNLSVESINAIINNSFKAQEDSERALELAEGANKANGTVITIDGEPQGTWDATFSQKLYEESVNKFDKDNSLVLTNRSFANEVYGYAGYYTIVIPLKTNTDYSYHHFKTWIRSGLCNSYEIGTAMAEVENVKQRTFNSGEYKYLLIGEIVGEDALKEALDNFMLVEGTTIPTIYYSYNQNHNITNEEAEFLKNYHNESKNILGQDSLIREKSYYNGEFVPHENANVFMVEVEPNTKYIFSDNGVPMKISYSAFWDENNNLIGNVSYDKTSITTPVNAKYFVLSIWRNSIEGIQIEKGDVITSYQPYNHNRHITNPQADFLKSECDKSANKLYAEDVLITADKGLTCKYVRSTGVLTITGTATENITNHGFNIPLIEKIPSGKNIYFGYEGNGGETDAYNLFLCASNGWEGTGGANLSYNNPLTHYTSIREANYVRFYLWNLSQGQSINVEIKLFVNYDYPLGYSEWNGEHLTKKDIKPVLVWKNGAVNSAFDEQDITTNYIPDESRVFIEFKADSNWNRQRECIEIHKDSNWGDNIYFELSATINGGYVKERKFTFKDHNTIHIEKAKSTDGSDSVYSIIPTKIWYLPMY